MKRVAVCLATVLSVSFACVQLAAQTKPSASPASPVDWKIKQPEPGQPRQGYSLLPGVESTVLYRGVPATGVYSHHAQIAFLDGTFYASWSNHRWGEDGPGQRLFCSTSHDGLHWRKAFKCYPSLGKMQNPDTAGRLLTADALVPVDGKMYVIAEVNDRTPRGAKNYPVPAADARYGKKTFSGRLGFGRLARSMSPKGKLGPIFWLVNDPPDPIDGKPQYPTQEDHHFSKTAAAIHQWWQDPVHLPAWDFRFGTASAVAVDGHHMCEPNVYRRPDGVYVKLARDCTATRHEPAHMYASTSSDGKTWTTPVPTNVPDSPSKATSGSLPDGRVFLIGNQVSDPTHHRRDPLVLSLSPDGKNFVWAAAIRAGAPPVNYPGRAKIPGFQYPVAIVARNAIWVIYSIGKEDVAVSRIPLSALDGKGEAVRN